MKRYDILILGGGLGGLACGVMLSREGLNVCVLEQHSTIGGCLQSFRRGSYVLDTGMHYVGSLSEGQTMYQYLRYLGVQGSVKLQKLDESGFDTFHFTDGTRFSHAMGYENFIDTLARDFPSEYEGLKQLCASIRRVGGLVAPEVLRNGRISGGGFEYMSMSAYEEICTHIRNPRLQNVMAGSCSLFAGEKATTSLYEYGMITHSNIEGAYCFRGGSQHFADALAGEIRRCGGEIVTGAKVTGIVLKGGSVDYVETADGEQYAATRTISSLHPQQTFALLRNNTVIRKAFFSRINSMRNTYGLFTTYLLLKPQSVRYRNHNSYLINNPDVWSAYGDWKGFNIAQTLLCMQANDHSEYTDVITLLTPMPREYYERWLDTRFGRRGAEYKEFKEQFSGAVLDFVSQFYPGLKEHIHAVHTASPLTYRDYTSTPDGSAYGIVKDYHNPLVTLFPTRTKIDNLLLTGQNLNIHGCLGTTISAAVTCSEILGMEYLARKIEHA